MRDRNTLKTLHLSCAGEVFHKVGYTEQRSTGTKFQQWALGFNRHRERERLLGRANMPKGARRFSLGRATKALQENVSRSGPAATASYTLVGGIILLGGLGYWADGRLGTAPWLLVVGLVLGIVIGFYEIVKTSLR